MRSALLLLALIGCKGLTHHVERNVPGDVDLDTPYAPEWGDPAAFQGATDPGEHQLGVAPAFYFAFGEGRVDRPSTGASSCTTYEIGTQLHLGYGQRDRSGGDGDFGYPMKSWGGTIGWAIAQTPGEMCGGSTVRGPLYLEGTRQFYFLTASLGAAVYPTPGDMDMGAQLTLSAAIWTLRMRYVEDSGFEIFGGYQLFLPASVTWSR